MKPEGSLSCSQVTTSGPSPHQSIHTYLIYLSILILSSQLPLGLLRGLFPSGLLDKNFVCISHLSHAYVLHASSIFKSTINNVILGVGRVLTYLTACNFYEDSF
jgi:hypothetical protein